MQTLINFSSIYFTVSLAHWLTGSLLPPWLNMTCHGFLDFWIFAPLQLFCFALAGSSFSASPLNENDISYSLEIDITVLFAVFSGKTIFSHPQRSATTAHCVSTWLNKPDHNLAPMPLLTGSGSISMLTLLHYV